MKKLFLLTLPLLLLTACGGDDSTEDTPTPPTPTNPTTPTTIELLSQTIEEGAEVDAATTTLLTLSYNVPVKIAAQSRITLNGSPLNARSNGASPNAIDIPLSLASGTDYTIRIAQGAIAAQENAALTAPSWVLHFKTKEVETPDNPYSANITPNPVAATTEQGQKLYNYFLEQYGQKTISSVMADVNWNNNCAEKVYSITGKYPAMNCYDFIHICFSPANWIDYTNLTPVRTWVEGGGIVQLMWHFNVPKSQGSNDYTCTPSETTFRAKNIFTANTWENQWFYSQMDKVVATILQLQEAGIAATWRPFHEAAGNATYRQQASWTTSWFWWGYDGADVYKKLWKTMFDYFKSKGVKNLIWIWTTQNYNGNSNLWAQDTNWYPGDEYVDIVARDLYGYNAAQNTQEFNEIQSTYPTKMVVLGECGHNDGKDPGRIGDCWNSGARWGHFLVWYQGEHGTTGTMCSDAWWRNAMSDSHVITRDQLPNLK